MRSADSLTESRAVEPSSPVVLAVLLALLGLAVGSWLDGVVARVTAGEPLAAGRRGCPLCGARARGPDLPLVWVASDGGRCATCGGHPGWQRLWLELGTATLLVLVGVSLGWDWSLPAYLYLAGVSVALAAIDVRTKRLPNALTLPSYPLFAGLLLPAAAAGDWGSYARAILGGVALFLAYLLLAVLNPAGMGLGDVKLAGVLGMALAWLGWDIWLLGSVLAFVLAAVVGVGMLVTRRAERRSTIPFGPFMVVGAWIAILAGPVLIGWYEAGLPG